MTQFSEDLRTLGFSPKTRLSDDDFVARVMAACSREPRRDGGTPPQLSPRRWAAWAFASAGAAAACVVLGVTAFPPKPAALPPLTNIAARGNPEPGLTATVQAFVGHVTSGAAPALLEGATLHPGDGILVRYSNPSARDVYLMVFAVDQQRNVHWIHPAYLDGNSNPTSLKLAPRVTDQVLPEVAEPENPTPGELEVYAVLSAIPLDVKSVESRVAISARPVSELFPQAEVETWKCTWVAR